MVMFYAPQTGLEVCKPAVEPHGVNGTRLYFGIEKPYRDATIYLHKDSTVDVTRFKNVKYLLPVSAGKYAGPET